MKKLKNPFNYNLRFYLLTFTRIKVLVLMLSFVNLSLPHLSIAETPQRIISLSPSTTEILFAAGLGDNVVGVTTFCDYPEEAKSKPKIGGMSNPSLEAVVSLKPDIVVMTIDGNPKEFQQKLRSLKINTFVFESLTLPELPAGIRKMGGALGKKDRFNTLASEIEQSINRFVKDRRSVNRKILFVVWPEPLIVAGPRTAIDDAINLLGGINIAGNTKGRYPKFSIEEIFHQSPDIIFIGKGHEDMKKLSRRLLKRLSNIPAVKQGKVFYVSDSLYKLGPRAIRGVEELSRCLNR